MIKKIKIFLVFLFIFNVVLISDAFAMEKYVTFLDENSKRYLDEEQVIDLELGLKNLSDKYNADFVLVMGPSYGDIEQTTLDYYRQNYIGRGEDYDGVIIYIDMDSRDLWLQTFGSDKVVKNLYQGDIDKLFNILIENGMRENDVYTAVRAYIDNVPKYYGREINPIELAIAFVIPTAASGIFLFSTKRTYEAKEAVKAYDVSKDAIAKFNVKDDKLISDNTTFIITPKPSNNSGGGFSSSGGSGARIGSGRGGKF